MVIKMERVLLVIGLMLIGLSLLPDGYSDCREKFSEATCVRVLQ